MQIAATLGMLGSAGSGCMPLAHRARTLPSVSLPSSVVRSIIRIARSSAHSFDAFLIDHAACERKASATGMWFVVRYPDRPVLLDPLIAFAREELEHFHRVYRVIE